MLHCGSDRYFHERFSDIVYIVVVQNCCTYSNGFRGDQPALMLVYAFQRSVIFVCIVLLTTDIVTEPGCKLRILKSNPEEMDNVRKKP